MADFVGSKLIKDSFFWIRILVQDSLGTSLGPDHKYQSTVVCPTCLINRRTHNTKRPSNVIKSKTNHVVVLETLSTTFHFLRAFSILVVRILNNLDPRSL